MSVTVNDLLNTLAGLDPETRVNIRLSNGRLVSLKAEDLQHSPEGLVIPSLDNLTDRPSIAKLLDSASKCFKAVQEWSGATGVWKEYEKEARAVALASLAFDELSLGIPYGQMKLPLPNDDGSRNVPDGADVCWMCITSMDKLQGRIRETINGTEWGPAMTYRFTAVSGFQCVESAAAFRSHSGRGQCEDLAARALYEAQQGGLLTRVV